jgi:CRP/FNR family transcriptional regulator
MRKGEEQTRNSGPNKAKQGTTSEVRQIDTFHHVPEAALGAALASARRCVYQMQQLMDLEGRCDRHVLVVVAGRVRMFRTAKGSELTLLTLRVGDIVGLSPWWGALARGSTFEATEQHTVVYFLERKRFAQLLQAEPQMGIAAATVLERLLGELGEVAEDLGLFGVRARLAHCIARNAPTDRDERLKLTHEQLAWHIGSQQERVTRELRTLREEELISSTPRRPGIEVLEVERLADYDKE